jgi:hypothetical protein
LQLARFLAGEHSLLGGAVLFAGTFGLYMASRSHSLDDWDSINFARAIEKFDVALQQPHPPGYPAYVFLSRLVNLITNDPLISLTTLSAISGAVCVVAFYALACDLGIGWAALPLATMPLFWLNSEMALTDVPGLAFAVVSVWLLNRALLAGSDSRWWQSARGYLIAGCVIAGVDAGVRPQDAAVPLAVLACYVAPTLWKRRGFSAALLRDAGLAGAALLVTCLLWAVPLYRNLTGSGAKFQPYQVQIEYVKDWDSLWSDPAGPYSDEPPPPLIERVKRRAEEFGSVFSSYFGGPEEGGLRAMIGLTAAVVALGVVSRRSQASRLALVWLISYGLFMLLVMQPTDPRKVLPVLPPMFLLLAGTAAAVNTRAWRTAVSIACLALAGVLAAKAVPLVRTLDSVATPPQQVAEYIDAWYSPDDTLILAATSLNHIRYYIPWFTSFSVIDLGDDDLVTQLDQRHYTTILVVDQDGPTIPPQYVQQTIYQFERNPLVLPKGSYTTMTVYQEASAATSEGARG